MTVGRGSAAGGKLGYGGGKADAAPIRTGSLMVVLGIAEY